MSNVFTFAKKIKHQNNRPFIYNFIIYFIYKAIIFHNLSDMYLYT